MARTEQVGRKRKKEEDYPSPPQQRTKKAKSDANQEKCILHHAPFQTQGLQESGKKVKPATCTVSQDWFQPVPQMPPSSSAEQQLRSGIGNPGNAISGIHTMHDNTRQHGFSHFGQRLPGVKAGGDFPFDQRQSSKGYMPGRGASNQSNFLMYNSQHRVHNTPSPWQSHLSRNDDFRSYPLSQIDAFAQTCIVNLAEGNDLVTVSRVMTLVHQHFRVNRIEDLGLRGEFEIDSINRLQKLQAKINASIQAFIKVRTISTLHELRQSLSTLDGKADFAEHNLGPLAKQPLVYDLFKFPNTKLDKEIPPLTTMDILDLLQKYMSEKNLWKERVKLEDFMEYVVRFYNVDSPYELGVRIQSVALGISVIKTAKREQAHIWGRIREEVKTKLKEECQTTMNKIKHAIMTPIPENIDANQFTPSTGTGLELRKSYVAMAAAHVINTVFENVCKLLGKNGQSLTQVIKLKTFASHLREIMYDPLLSDLFQLSICLGSLKPPEKFAVNEVVDEEEDNKDQDANDRHQGQPVSSASSGNQPTDADVLEELKRYIDRLMQVMGVPKLRDLAAIEKRLCQHFKAPNFVNLLSTQRTFLEFIALDHPQVLEVLGGSFLGIGSSNPLIGSPYRPSRMDIMEFIEQCDLNKRSREEVSAALCSHYQVTSVEELGHGKLAMLMKSLRIASKNTLNQQASHSRPITYEAALCAGTRSHDKKSQQVGLLGTQSLERALACLNSAPLLENLAEWTHWELVFEPEHGDLKSFLERNPGAHLQPAVTICALETKPGVLLKLATHTTVEHFSTHAQNGDAINTAGHLVSLVVQDGITNVAMALLGNHMEAALANILRKEMEAGSSDLQGLGMMEFTLDVLTRIPVQISQVVAQQVVMKPLSSVVGSDATSQELLLHVCKTSTQKNTLQTLGLLLGISQWKTAIEERLPAASEDDICDDEDDGEAGIDVDTLLLAAESTPKVKTEVKQEEQNHPAKEEEQKTDTNEPAVDDVIIVTDSVEDESIETLEDDDEVDEIIEGKDIILIEEEDDAVDKEDIARNNCTSTGDTTKSKECQPSGDELPISDRTSQIVECDAQLEQLELTEDQHHIWTCKRVIDNILQDEFGVGMQLNKNTRQLMQRHQNRIGRSLQRLSQELYSKDTHFVLELVQNADDNKYDEGVEPTLVFVVDTEAVTAMNNEKGFSERDVRALCDVGKSTKGKHKKGYIGHKGIGFKSVFRVTDAPQIHSNGYHICFEHGKDPMGYILPTWIGPQNLTELGNFQPNADWATTIRLPLKGDLQRTSSLVNKFQDIQPSLLLFLQRLRSIVIVNKDGGNSRQMKRQDMGNNVIEIKHNQVTESWLVVKEMLDVAMLHREKVASTELALAFPITTGASRNQNREQCVFAFLPLRSYGFHFIIQGDFDIPSSREDLDSDSAWNQWLQQHIAPLFVRALQTFKDYYKEDPIKGVCKFLQYVPLESQILTEFFKKVAISIHQRLKATPCLPVVTDEAEDNVEWKLPAETVMVRDPLIQDVVQSLVLKTHLNCHYLHQKVVEECSSTLLSNLGVKKLHTSDLIGILKSVSIKATNTGEHLPLEVVAKCLVCIYRCRERDYDVSQDNLDQLRAIPVIPLMSGETVAVKDHNVFLPIKADDEGQFQTGSKVLRAVEADMAMVDARLLSSLDDVANSQIQRLLEELGVNHISPRQVIHHHILPVLRCEEKWQSKMQHNPDILVGYIVYIKEQYEKQPSVCNLQTDLRPYTQVITNHGPCNPAKTPVHFPKVYGNAIDLPKELPGCDWVLLDNCYLYHRGPHMVQREQRGWQQFFTKLGVLCYLAVESKVVTYKESEMSSSPWADLYQYWPKPTNGVYKIKDKVCRELEQLILYDTSNPEKKKQQRHSLFNLLHQRWQEIYAKHVNVELVDSKTGKVVQQVLSSLAILLRTSAWLPSLTDGVLKFRRPADIFLFSKRLFDLLDTNVPYLTMANIPSDSLFLQFLNVCNLSCINPDFMLARLKRWCSYQEEVPMTTTGYGAFFKTSLGHIVRVYRYLFENCRQKDLKKLFDQYPVVFVPQDSSISDWKENWDTLVQGQFVHKKCTYWQDPTGLLQQHKARESELPQRFALSEFYQDLHNIFVSGKLIDQAPTLKEYVVLLVDMVSEINLPDNNKLHDVLKVYAMLGKKCSEQGVKEASIIADDNREGNILESSSQSFLHNLLQEEAVFPTRANRWVTLADKPILCDEDSVELEKLFTHNPLVHLLNMADKDRLGRTIREPGSSRGRFSNHKENIKQFLEACRIQTLKECVEREFIPTLLQASPSVQLFMHTICPYIQLYISTHSQRDDNFSELYQQLQEENMSAILKTMAFYEVEKLEVVHRMKHKADILATSTIDCGIEKAALYVIKKAVPQIHKNTQVRREISKMFSRGSGLCQKALFSFLGSLLLLLGSYHPDQGINYELCTELDLEPLEKGTDEWQIPKPIIPEIKPPSPPPPPLPEILEETKQCSRHVKGDSSKLEGEGMRSWPPRSSTSRSTDFKGPKSQDGGLKMWPPPAPPPSANPIQPPSPSANLIQSPPSLISLGGDKSTPCTTNLVGSQRQSPMLGNSGTTTESMESGEDGSVSQRQESAAATKSFTTGQRQTENDEGEQTSRNRQPTTRDQLGERDRTLEGDDVQIIQGPSGKTQQRSIGEESNDDVMVLEEETNVGNSSREQNVNFDNPSSVMPGLITSTPRQFRQVQPLAPLWRVLPNVEVELEHLAKGTEIKRFLSSLEVLPDVDEAESNIRMGRWGEELVYNYLRQQNENSQVIWVNESGETGKPFDVVIEGKDFTIYVEVKATRLDQKELFEISSKEIAFAEQQKEFFHLYRVYNAGSSENVRLCRLRNLSLKMERKEVRLCMYI